MVFFTGPGYIDRVLLCLRKSRERQQQNKCDNGYKANFSIHIASTLELNPEPSSNEQV